MKCLASHRKSILRTGRIVLQRCGLFFYALIGSGAARAADANTEFLQLTGSIDIRIAAAISALSLIILTALWKADFKGNFGVWGGRLIVFLLVVLNIGLWATQV